MLQLFQIFELKMHFIYYPWALQIFLLFDMCDTYNDKMFRSVPFCQGNISHALDKERNNCSATPEDSCKLSYAASFAVLHFHAIDL